MQRLNNRRTRAHLLRLIKKTVKTHVIVQYRHALVDKMISGIKGGSREGVQSDGLGTIQDRFRGES